MSNEDINIPTDIRGSPPTRASNPTRREYQHEEDIGNDEDLYALNTTKRQKK